MDLNYEMMYIVKPAEQEISKQVNAKLEKVITDMVDVLKTLITGAKESLRMRLMALAEVFMYCLCLKDHRQLSKSLIA